MRMYLETGTLDSTREKRDEKIAKLQHEANTKEEIIKSLYSKLELARERVESNEKQYSDLIEEVKEV